MSNLKKPTREDLEGFTYTGCAGKAAGFECPICQEDLGTFKCPHGAGAIVNYINNSNPPAVPVPGYPHTASLAGDAQARKAAPMFEGLIGYFPNALACVSNVSKVGNEQHNPGLPLQWAFDKSTDEKDCLLRHLAEAGTLDTDGLRHSAKVAWRALANLERELLAGDPTLKPGVNVKGLVRK